MTDGHGTTEDVTGSMTTTGHAQAKMHGRHHLSKYYLTTMSHPFNTSYADCQRHAFKLKETLWQVQAQKMNESGVDQSVSNYSIKKHQFEENVVLAIRMQLSPHQSCVQGMIPSFYEPFLAK